MKTGIIVDSSSDLMTGGISCRTAELDIIPLHIVVGDRDFADDDNIDVDEMLAAMKHSRATSACPSAERRLASSSWSSSTRRLSRHVPSASR